MGSDEHRLDDLERRIWWLERRMTKLEEGSSGQPALPAAPAAAIPAAAPAPSIAAAASSPAPAVAAAPSAA